MLYTYPAPTSELNWLSDLLTSGVEEALAAVAEQRKSKTWNSLVPENRRDVLKLKRGLRNHYSQVVTAARSLTSDQARKVLEQLREIGAYEPVLSGSITYPDWTFAPTLDAAIKNMFDYGFRLLSDLPSGASKGPSIRDARYREIYDAISEWRVCPFCGVIPLDSPYPLMPRHPLDHYLALSLYPVFGANLSNLITMCERCNSSFKGAKDLIRSDDGHPRLCIDPHSSFVAQVSLLRSALFAGPSGVTPEWQVDLVPDVEEVRTWDSVFRVKDRYRLNYLGPRFNDWLEDFAIWARGVSAQMGTQPELSMALSLYADSLPRNRDLSFLREPAFRFLSSKAAEPGHEGEALLRVICAVIDDL